MRDAFQPHSQTVRARWWLVLAATLLLVPLLAACSGDDDDEPRSTAATSTTVVESPSPTSEPTATPEPPATATTATVEGLEETWMGMTIEPAENEGGTFIEGSASDLQTVNPVVAYDTAAFNFLALIFEGLVELHPETLEPSPLLAASWEVSPDGLTWTFNLRDGVTWHDGEPFTADDVKFTYDLHMNPDSGSAYGGDLMMKVASIEVVDPLTIDFTLPQPNPDFAVGVALHSILPAHIWSDVAPADIAVDPGSTGEDADRVVGTGPFVFKEWIPNDHLTATANEEYWGGAPYLDEYIYKIVPDSVAAVQQLRTGEIDWFSQVPGVSVGELESEDIEITISDTLSFGFYGYNLDPEQTTVFQDAAVRQALLYAVDREALNDALSDGFGTVTVGTMPTLSWAYNPDGVEYPYDFDPDKARELLDEAGWLEGADGVREKDGERLEFTMHATSDNPQAAAYLSAFQEFWAEVGAEMTPVVEPTPALIERVLQTHDFDIFLLGFSWDPSPDQSAMFSCDAYEAGFNLMRYCNPEVDELLAEALKETDQAKRIELYTEYQNVLLADLPVAILSFPQSIDGYSARIHNLFPNSINARFNAETWWLDQ